VSSGELFAEVVVHSPLGYRGRPLEQTFHYSVPVAMQGSLLPGHLVWVPFGARELPGIVLALSRTSPVVETKDILHIIDPHPVLTPYQIDLMHWISQYYRTPPHLVAWNMFPPGVSWKAETMLYAGESAGEGTKLRSDELAILELVGQGPLPQDQVRRQLKRKFRPAAVERMVRKGWLRRELEVRGPQVKPKMETVVHLTAVPQEEQIAALSRASQQQTVLLYLRQRAMAEGASLPLVIPLAQLREEAGVTRPAVDALVRRGLLALSQREVRRDPLAGHEFVTTQPPKFTLDQELAWQSIAQGLGSARSPVFLLHGVTGSGKTEIYLRALAQVLQEGGQGIVLVPEIALTPQTIRRFAARFPERLAVLHSKLSPGERYDEWRRIRSGLADVVIGPRSALFAPLPRLRLIVVDEEHESSYKQQEMPCYHARDVAIRLAELTAACVILGSATPDVTSYHRAQLGQYRLLQLPKRIMGHQRGIKQQEEQFHLIENPEQVKALGPEYEEARYMDLPPVELVDLRAELRAGNRSPFSRALQRAMEVALAAGQQVILFLNRRGASTFVMCRDCGYVIKCPGCDVALTFHADNNELLCHHCSYRCDTPTVCPECGSKRIRFFGIGTQKVEQLVHELFPRARVLRWDRDVTGSKGAHDEILDHFISHRADVLIGTQMIAKGLDLPLVTLVGVITADIALRLPDFRASERTFQLLTQVAGRAGRSILGGKVIIQTYAPQHFCIQAASHHDYEGFYRQEIEFRRQQRYPPFSRLARLLFTHSSANKCEEEAEKLSSLLTSSIARAGAPEIDVIGPVPCFIERIRGRYRWQVILRGPDPARLLADLTLPLGWQVDIDPVNLL